MEDANILLIPLLIFLARILDVSIGTVKLIFIGRGYKKLAPVLAFIEITLWLVVITHVMSNLDKPINFIAYALGFSAGTYVGLIIEEKLALGNVVFQIITRDAHEQLGRYLEEEGYDYTSTSHYGEDEGVHIMSIVAKRKKVDRLAYIIRQFHPRAFFTIEEVKYVSKEQMPLEPGVKQKIKSSIRSFKSKDRIKRALAFKKSK